MSDKMREEFEIAISEESGQSMTAIYLTRRDESYSTSPLHYAWWAWKASRESLVIELPDTVANTGTLTSTAVLSYKRECREAIEAAGLKVKP